METSRKVSHPSLSGPHRLCLPSIRKPALRSLVMHDMRYSRAGGLGDLQAPITGGNVALTMVKRTRAKRAQAMVYEYLGRAGYDGLSVDDLAALVYDDRSEKACSRIRVALKRLRDAGYVETMPVKHRLTLLGKSV